jgi:hypothetical protein
MARVHAAHTLLAGAAPDAHRGSEHPASSECMAPAHARPELKGQSVSLRDSVEVELEYEARPNNKEGFSRCSSGKSSSGKSGNSSERNRKARREAEKEAEEARLASVWPDERKYNPRSLFLFTLQNPVRRIVIKWIEWKHWDSKVIGIIMLNTVTLAMFDCFDKPSMRACAPQDLNQPPGPYGYCSKMTTGIATTRTATPSAHMRPPAVECKISDQPAFGV